jgi:hypothetical protein
MVGVSSSMDQGFEARRRQDSDELAAAAACG